MSEVSSGELAELRAEVGLSSSSSSSSSPSIPAPSPSLTASSEYRPEGANGSASKLTFVSTAVGSAVETSLSSSEVDSELDIFCFRSMAFLVPALEDLAAGTSSAEESEVLSKACFGLVALSTPRMWRFPGYFAA